MKFLTITSDIFISKAHANFDKLTMFLKTDSHLFGIPLSRQSYGRSSSPAPPSKETKSSGRG
jgi:hypothetical protein